MIYDTIDNFINEIPNFMPCAAQFTDFLKAARELDFEALEALEFAPLDLRFGRYETQPEGAVPFETHKKYWDLQLLFAGEELIGYAPAEALTLTRPYDEAEDITFYEGRGQNLKLSPGMAVLLAPWDAHRPGVQTENGPCSVKKIVIKLPWETV
ncbi:MAG: YhcH/YjgK/YiaL family protein [Cloacibacillus sp.]